MDTPVLRLFRPDDAPWLVEQHGVHYARAEGFDDSFGPLVARILDDFIADHDPDRERGWIAEADGQRLGSIFCVRLDETTAKLRLFLLVPEARGRGLGRRLLDTCMGFARDKGYTQMQLWTHESHRAACALYAATGWQLTDSKPVHSFGVDLVEQSWKITL
ncbi:GNAT family N-acetyltransferase [Ruegeria pomeroyi]|uniref:Acetyltransferase, GNAT family n=2 Tax=Ruegeria pomeroyi TaxID=89184 RepID=Q5LSK0_RUEPO|nr:GNAT family N-acetyltransferase [Ruegeria pomeroyi]HCE70684.1 GNAT family N-acetyltransferase [Ruegeria sp.]AAV95047.1 acetyltransferase, GNAT family [Ruegeria pomeroyi DSS-3]NVK98094.1 GNAT family N-acetyltransferase [Ruegeria pomeroyi]NVL01814.1 GNAT family N-acetyltransferase [Ruegeria pomeroyi]QWV08625.1 GNAT family N-acetyltransferase [Ruegeria pomeroyi]